MEKGERAITIEILGPEDRRETWFNEFVGETFEATIKTRGFYQLTQKGLDKLTKVSNSVFVTAMVHAEFACVYGEEVEKSELIKFETHPKRVKFIREVRILRATRDYVQHDRTGTNVLTTFFKEGDLFEEQFDNPNSFIRLNTKKDDIMRVYSLEVINGSRFLLPSFEYVKTIDVKESAYFESQKKKLASSYKSTRNAIARANEKLNELRFLLNIEDDE